MSEAAYRFATPADVGALVRLRLDFLAEGGQSAADTVGLPEAIHRYFSAALPAGDYVAALAEMDGHIIGTSGLIYHRYPPRPKIPNGLAGYILNVYVMPGYRRQSHATRLLQMLVGHARGHDVKLVTLHHWPGKSGVYAKLGFQPREREMGLEL